MEILKRHSVPGKYDTCKKGTLCHVYLIENDSKYSIYCQKSHDEDNPLWELIDVVEIRNNEIQDGFL